MIIGLEGAHPACVGPLIELLLEEGAPVRVCFAAHELLEAPEDARVVLLHAARDAEFLNIVRPVVSERRLRVLVWLRPGDRRELSRRARDFLDWMQESVDVPEFVPGYGERALRRALDEGAAIVWEGPPLREVVPEVTVLLPDVAEDEAIVAMRKGPVVVHRPLDAREIARFEAMHRAAGGAFGIIWNEPAILPAGATRIIADPLDWEVASEWLEKVGVDDPRIEAARLHLDPVEVSRRAGTEPPALLVPEQRSEAIARRRTREIDASREEQPRSLAWSGGSTLALHRWWEETLRICNPMGPPEDTGLIVPRPTAWPGLRAVVDRLHARIDPELHVVAGAAGSGVSTELFSLGLQLHEQRCVVMLDVQRHFESAVRDLQALDHVGPWELMLLISLAALRVGRDRWGVRWGKEYHLLGKAIHSATGTHIDVEQLVSALAGARAPDVMLPSIERWPLPMGNRPYWSGMEDRAETDDQDWGPRDLDELANVFRDRDQAVRLVARVGFPLVVIPTFHAPLKFWYDVAREAREGALPGASMRPILEEAARSYPHNPMFARYRNTSSGTGIDAEQREALARVVLLIVDELRVSTNREVVFVLDGLGSLNRASPIDELIRSLWHPAQRADFVLSVPRELPYRAPRYHHVQTSSHIDDIPVIDVREPTRYGPGIGFFREVLERRFASNPHPRPSIPETVLDQLCWASGGRPGECLRLVYELAMLAHDEPLDRLHDLTTVLLREHRNRLVQLERSSVLYDCLRNFWSDLPVREETKYLEHWGALRLYPTPEGGYRALPHPLLIEGLLRG